MDNTQPSPAVAIFRWLAFIPAAALASVAVILVVNLLWNLARAINPFPLGLIRDITAYAGAGYAFVNVGTTVAPAGKKTLSIVLAALGVVYALAVLVSSIAIQNYWQGILCALFLSAGAIGAAVCVRRE